MRTVADDQARVRDPAIERLLSHAAHVTAGRSATRAHTLCEMRPLRYSINVTLDGCCDHLAGIPPDEELHRHTVENLNQADALLFGRVTYEMMESAFRPSAATGARPRLDGTLRPDDQRGKEVRRVEHLEQVDWNAELVRGDLAQAVQQLKRESGNGLFVGGVKLPLALTELGLIDEYEFVVHPRLAGHGPTLFAGLSKHVDLKLVSRLEFGSGGSGDAVRAEKVAIGIGASAPARDWSGRRDLNPRPQRPERCALTKLRYFPVGRRA